MPAIQSDHKGRFDEPLLKSIDWALNPEETQRPQSVAEFRGHLQASLDEERTAAAPILRARSFGYLGRLLQRHDRNHELRVVRTGGVIERDGDKTMKILLNAGRGGVGLWRELAGRIARGAGRAGMNVANRIKARIPDAMILGEPDQGPHPECDIQDLYRVPKKYLLVEAHPGNDGRSWCRMGFRRGGLGCWFGAGDLDSGWAQSHPHDAQILYRESV